MVNIVSGTIIATGAVVIRDLLSNATVGRMPARIIRARGSGEVRNTT